MVETFRAKWWPEAKLVVYAEGFRFAECGRVTAAGFPQWFENWKARHENNPDARGRNKARNRSGREYDFRFDCRKFAHKIAALTDYALYDALEMPACSQSRVIVWMDADTLSHAAVTPDWIEGLLFGFHGRGPNEPEAYMAWLDRERLYPECGFLLFNARHAKHVDFMRRLLDLYRSDDVLQMRETHDSYVVQQLVLRCIEQGWFGTPRSLSGSARTSHHPFPLSELGSRLDHAKGSRKAAGRTPVTEIAGRRKEAHWR